jgi:hypothetical protein
MEEENQKEKQTVRRKPGRRANGTARKDDWLGKNLRELYDDYARAPLPDNLKDVLDQLGHDSDKGRGGGKGR